LSNLAGQVSPRPHPGSVSSVAHLVVDDIQTARISQSDFHHVARVLRARAGELITATDGKGAWRIGAIPANWSDPSIAIDWQPPQINAARQQLCVAVALVKGDKPETVVQKLTEIGIDRIVFLAAAHSVVKWDADRSVKHLARLGLVAREALMQCRGVWLPSVEGPYAPADFVAAELFAGRVVAAADMSGTFLTPENPTNISTLMVGPEGGWSAEERSVLVETVSFGEHVFRAETAAIAAAVMLNVSRHHQKR
jgi:16S rRNA (uracil1498-N3)-methyltransferase